MTVRDETLIEELVLANRILYNQGVLDGFGHISVRDSRNPDHFWLAKSCALELGVHLSGHGGDCGGIIGALAAVGLHLSGTDGMFIWMPGIRELRGAATYRQLRSLAAIDAACAPDGAEPAAGDLIELGEWVRPILRNGRAVLLVDARSNGTAPWALAPREVVKSH